MASESRDRLHALVDSLPDVAIPDAISLFTHLDDDDPLSKEELENLRAAEEDRRERRLTPLADYERQRGL